MILRMMRVMTTRNQKKRVKVSLATMTQRMIRMLEVLTDAGLVIFQTGSCLQSDLASYAAVTCVFG